MFGDWRQLKNKGKIPEPLEHPMSCVVEFNTKFNLQTMVIDKIKLIDKTL